MRPFYILSLLLLTFPAFAQTFSWQVHADYQNCLGLEIVKNNVYCYSSNGFFYYKRADNQAIKLSKLNDLSETEIAQIEYSTLHQKLLIAYTSGGIDIAEIDKNGEISQVTPYNFIKSTSAIQSSKRINDIRFYKDFAFLATDFGLVQFDMLKNEIKETILNILPETDLLVISKLAIENDSIFIKTPDGILSTSLNPSNNLKFYGNWELANNRFRLFASPSFPKHELISSPQEIKTDTDGKIWIADSKNGLISNFQGNFKSYSPNGLKGSVSQLNFQDNRLYSFGRFVQYYTDNQWFIDSNKTNSEKTLIDANQNVWQISSSGITVRNPKNSQFRSFSYGTGYGNLPSSTVYSIAEDRDGLIWIGTDNGVAVINNSSAIFTTKSEAYTPYFTKRRLFLQEKVMAIAIDGGNRKWFGTPRGITLLNAETDDLILQFNTQNSPLPSDNILDLAIDKNSNQLFIATDAGVISYQNDATEPVETLSEIKIYPNPVRPEHEGILTISGLVANTKIKITDASARLVYETTSNGGIATWNLENYRNQISSSGIYYVFAVSETGNEAQVGKFLLIK